MKRTVFTGGQVFDGTSTSLADVVVEGRRIVDVGVGLDGDDAVDCAGMSIVPGLFDCHVHVLIRDLDVARSEQEPYSLPYYEAVRNLSLLLDQGITSARDAAGADAGVRRAIEKGLIEGPRLQLALVMLSQTGGHSDLHLPSGGSRSMAMMMPNPGRPRAVRDGVDDVRRGVREILRAGADAIKVATTGGVMSVGDDPRHAHFRDDELEVIAAEAAAAGSYFFAHAQGAEGIKAALRHGARSIEHGYHLDDEAIDLMLSTGAWLVPTLSATQAIVDAGDRGVPIAPESLALAREALDAHRASFARAVDAGVKVAMGTDSPPYGHPSASNLDELQLMVRASSMTPADAWRATTASAAALLRQHDLGAIAPGALADLVVLDGRLADLGGLRERIRHVVIDGRRVR
ncbi:amidohydrolase family protein [Leifsonia shinshuensis]|uniref:metal-dependent hydrolase family protein n=1 Tax=Leifsonia shinshuensis TaxID=150026 RepID=UPI001F50FD77|nr:amidohydrolase family protein [Leifsonia shinshuensis]MCI0157800.1 amidohydrolase family protein [Leifsonia shinshuensis]